MNASRGILSGTVLIASGAVLIALNGSLPEPNHTLSELLLLFQRPSFVAWISVLSISIILVLFLSHVIEHSLNKNTYSPLANSSLPESEYYAQSKSRRPLRRWSEPPMLSNDMSKTGSNVGFLSLFFKIEFLN